MSGPVLAVFDDSPDYVNRFLEYAGERRDLPFEVHGFTQMDALEKYVASHGSCILLISAEEAFERDEEQTLEERVEKLVLKMGERCIYLGERRNSSSTVKHICKYQSANKILDELTAFCREKAFCTEDADPAAEADVTGIYLPVYSEAYLEKILLAANNAAEGKRTLFISLRRFSGLERRLGGCIGAGLSDVIYYYKVNKGMMKEAIEREKFRMNAVDVLTCSSNLEDLDEIEDWPAFLKALAVAGGYQKIILDMGEAMRNLEEAFDMCSGIYIPHLGSEEDEKWMSELKMFFLERGREDLLEKVNVIS